MPAKTRTAPTATAPKSPGTADGKQTTARLVPGDRILVTRSGEKVDVVTRLTGAQVATVTAVKPVTGGRRTRYTVETDLGASISVSGTQTWRLAPETAAEATEQVQTETADEAVERVQKERLAAENAENAQMAANKASKDEAPVIDLAAEAAKRREDFKAKNVKKAQAAKVTAEPARPAEKAAPAKKAPAAKKAAAAKKAPAGKATPAPAKKTTQPTEATQAKAAHVKLPDGYAIRWDNGGYLLAKKGAGAAADGAGWLVICTTHGDMTTAKSTKEGDEKGRKSDRVNWCKGCKAA